MRSAILIIIGYTQGTLISDGLLSGDKYQWVCALINMVAFGCFMYINHKQHMKDINSLRK